MQPKKIATLSMFTVIALALFVAESAIPVPVPIPGIKLGLANIITLILLLNYSPADTFLVLLVRILLSALFAGQGITLLYSLAGGILCFAVMCLLNRFLCGHFIFLTSIFGAAAHNIGQTGVAVLLTRTPGVLSYLPFLLLSGVITGLFTGLCAHFTQKYLMPHIPK